MWKLRLIIFACNPSFNVYCNKLVVCFLFPRNNGLSPLLPTSFPMFSVLFPFKTLSLSPPPHPSLPPPQKKYFCSLFTICINRLKNPTFSKKRCPLFSKNKQTRIMMQYDFCYPPKNILCSLSLFLSNSCILFPPPLTPERASL